MDFKLNIGTLTTTINKYDKLEKTLTEILTNVDNTIEELTETGWSGESRDKFIELHQRKKVKYEQLLADIQYMKNALEYEIKPRAVKLKKRSEDFVNCIKRTGTGGAITSDDEGIISLEGNQFRINGSIDNCTSNHYPKMNSQFEDIMNLVNNLEYTSFDIGDNIGNLQTSLKNQTTSLTDFDDSFNIYCNDVREIESTAGSIFGNMYK